MGESSMIEFLDYQEVQEQAFNAALREYLQEVGNNTRRWQNGSPLAASESKIFTQLQAQSKTDASKLRAILNQD